MNDFADGPLWVRVEYWMIMWVRSVAALSLAVLLLIAGSCEGTTEAGGHDASADADALVDSRVRDVVVDSRPDSDASAVPAIVLDRPLAFPTAEGFGQNATGGEGGEIVRVTNLDDQGPGSLRHAVEEVSGRRIVHFDVAGNIVLRTQLVIRNGDLTIAGETAPGDGIALVSEGAAASMGGSLFTIATSNVIMRFLRFRRRGEEVGSNSGGGGILGSSDELAQDIIFDHCSWSWMSDDLTGAAFLGATRITYQRCFFFEPVPKQGQGYQHTKGTLFYSDLGDLSLIQNVWAHCGQRTPSASCYTTDARYELINNVVYNRGSSGMSFGVRAGGADQTRPADGTLSLNLVGNYFIEGPQTFDTRYDMGINAIDDGPTRAYVRDNITMQRPTSDLPEWDCMGEGPNLLVSSPASASRQSVTPFDMAFDPNRALPSEEVEAFVLANVGANISRDSADARVVDEIANRTGAIINDPGIVPHAYPTLEGAPWVYAQGTLIPQEFASTHGVSATDQVINVWDFGDYRVVNDIGATAYQIWRWHRAGDFQLLQTVE